MSQWQALSGQYPLQQNMGAAHSIAIFLHVVIKNDGTVFNLFNLSSDFQFFLGWNFTIWHQKIM
jgi:hypothetical protein